jgi:ATP-binding protein involved in chromosome partitioning
MSENRDAHRQQLEDALTTVRLGADLRNVVEAGFLQHLAHCDGAVKATFAIPVQLEAKEADALKKSGEDVLRKVPGVKHASVTIKHDVSKMARSKPGTPTQPVKNIIAVASGKGGVGKSTVAVNLAAALHRAGASVGILDADIYGPSIPTMLGAKGETPMPVEGEGGKRWFGPVEAHGIRLMSMGFLVEDEKPVIWRGPMLHSALKQFFGDVAWGDLDYLIVDLPPGTGDVALTMAQSIDLTGAVVVSTPQEVALVDARKALRMFEETGIPILGLVENMTGEIFGEGAVAQWAKNAGHAFLGSIPLQVAIRKSGDGGKPAALLKDEASAQPFLALARAVAFRVAEMNYGKSKEAPVSIELG